MIRVIKASAAVALLAIVALHSAALAQTSAPAAPPDLPNHIVLGDIAAQIIQWSFAAFGPLISAAAFWLVVRLLKAVGIKNTDLLKDQLQRIVINGVNAGAAKAMEDLRGRGHVDVKGKAAQYALWYAQTHGEDIIKSLGLDPYSGEAVEAIKARIETAIADPATPTSPLVTPSVVNEQTLARAAR